MKQSKQQINVIVSRKDLTLPEIQEQKGLINVIYSTSTIVIGVTDSRDMEFKLAGQTTYAKFDEVQAKIPGDATAMGIVSYGKEGVPLVITLPKDTTH